MNPPTDRQLADSLQQLSRLHKQEITRLQKSHQALEKTLQAIYRWIRHHEEER